MSVLEELKKDVEMAQQSGFSESEIMDFLYKNYDKNDVDSFFEPIESKDEEVWVGKGVKVITVEGKPGKDGDNGKTPTRKELLELIKPLIPKIPKPKDGYTPSKNELLSLIKPLIPEVEDGYTPTDKELIELIKPLIPEPKNPSKKELVDLIKSLIPEEKKLTGNDIIDLINALESDKKISASHLDKRIINRINQGLGGRGYTPARGEIPSGAVNGINIIFTIANIPYNGVVSVYVNGQRGTVNQDYTYSGVTITFVIAPPIDSNIQVDYEY